MYTDVIRRYYINKKRGRSVSRWNGRRSVFHPQSVFIKPNLIQFPIRHIYGLSIEVVTQNQHFYINSSLFNICRYYFNPLRTTQNFVVPSQFLPRQTVIISEITLFLNPLPVRDGLCIDRKPCMNELIYGQDIHFSFLKGLCVRIPFL